MDLFFFDTLGAQNLDAYQHIEGWEDGHTAVGLSSTGPKRLVALSGEPGQRLQWTGIRTYGDLCKHTFSLERDRPEHPWLAGEIMLEDVAARRETLPVNTALSAIRIRSVSCDFKDRPYARHTFDNSLIYLQYAGIEYLPLGTGDGVPVSYINPGRLDSAAVMALPQPSMILQPGLGRLGSIPVYPHLRFCCYANPVTEARLGRPVTRLVLEGDVGEQHCYYPIELPGLAAASTYELDITLLRMGTSDPDIPVRSGIVRVDTLVRPWETREPSFVFF